MEAAAAPVHGRLGPRRQRENSYERKTECGCVDKNGEPAVPTVDLDGTCIRCGHRAKGW